MHFCIPRSHAWLWEHYQLLNVYQMKSPDAYPLLDPDENIIIQCPSYNQNEADSKHPADSHWSLLLIFFIGNSTN